MMTTPDPRLSVAHEKVATLTIKMADLTAKATEFKQRRALLENFLSVWAEVADGEPYWERLTNRE